MVKTTKLISPIGREILTALKRLEKTQDWLAEQMDVSSNAVSKWIRLGSIARDNAVKLADLLNIPLDRLLAGKANVFIEALESLPLERSKSIITQFMYQIEHAEDVLGQETAGRYSKMIHALMKDMERRRKVGK